MADVNWPFTTSFSPLVDAVRAHGTRWAAEFRLVRTPQSLRRFRQADTPWLAAATYPEAENTLLHCAHDWMVWLIAFDDEFDESGVGRDPNQGQAITARMYAVLEGAEDNDESPASLALSDLAGRLRYVGGPSWKDRFLRHVDEYFQSYGWESRNRELGLVPSPEEYLQQRLHTGAVQTCFDLVQPALGLETESLVWESAPVRALEALASEVISLTNDIVSYPKERARGDFHNLVAIHCHRDGLTVDESVSLVVQRINDDLSVFESAAIAASVATPPVDRRSVNRYADGLRAWMKGNYDWSLRSARFSKIDSTPVGQTPAHIGDILER
ncbi:hypothetical protein ACIOMM_35375 [Streptomyces sp. NPDC087908]|uniref:terpene synthase family protein n=1 Tax=Streptomyces sp. NPDC087908 TaxID=3365820 RepID=UPI003824A3D9